MIEKVIKMLEQKYCITIVKRIICSILLAFEVEKEVISEKLQLSERSIEKYERMLENGRTEELQAIKGNSRKSELEDYKEEIFAELETGEYKTLREIASMIEKKTGLVRSRFRIGVFLKKTDIVRSKRDLYRLKQTPPNSGVSMKTY
jgi:transposase